MSFEYTTPAIVKWKLDDFMDAIDQFEDSLARKTHHQMFVGKDYQTILIHISGKSILTARELLTLCAHGYPDGALSLGRNLYEQMMIVAFFETHKNDIDFQEYVDDFFLSYEVQRNKCLRNITKYLSDVANDLDSEKERLKKQTKQQIKSDYWWARCDNFSHLVDCVVKAQADDDIRQFLGVHYARYKRACLSLHASCIGNSNRIGHATGFEVVDTSPTEYGHSGPLIFAAISLISITGFISAAFQIDNTKSLKQLNELAIFYQEQETKDTIII